MIPPFPYVYVLYYMTFFPFDDDVLVSFNNVCTYGYLLLASFVLLRLMVLLLLWVFGYVCNPLTNQLQLT
jgi:hypothetical protein